MLPTGAAALWLSDPAGEPWVVEQLAAAATLALRSAGPESAAVFLRRHLTSVFRNLRVDSRTELATVLTSD